MSEEVAVICSRADPASLNIAERLLELVQWQDRDGYLAQGQWRLVIHDGEQTKIEGLDSRLKGLGLRPCMVILPCRHVSRTGLPWFGGHFTGIGRSLSAAAPSGLRSFLRNLRRLAPEGVSVSAEATHHGPVDVTTPSFFAEIGSSERQWRSTHAGDVVARAILMVQRQELPVFLGFGGGHYVPRQTDLLFGAGIAFGHLFSSYQVDSLDAETVERARLMSGASFAYLDRKSLRSSERQRIEALLEEADLPILRRSEIRDRFPKDIAYF